MQPCSAALTREVRSKPSAAGPLSCGPQVQAPGSTILTTAFPVQSADGKEAPTP